MNIPTVYVIGLSAVLFTLGVIGVLVRRNAIVIFMSIELMLNAANLAFIAFARQAGSMAGQVFVFGLALIVAIHRSRGTIDIDEISSLHG